MYPFLCLKQAFQLDDDLSRLRHAALKDIYGVVLTVYLHDNN
jgi:hypothetical protein